MNKNLSELINLEKISKLLEGFNKSTGFVTAILDLEGNVLSKSGWRQICTEFHRVNEKTAERCTYSDNLLAGNKKKGEKFHTYTCLNGLTDVVVPLEINGEHVGNLFTGQFFLEEPDIDFFKKQANKFGFDEKEYLNALSKVPVVSQEKVKPVMDFLFQMTNIISEMGIEKIEEVALNKRLIEREIELKASNQQLEASNQQLRATEQQLRAANEQLTVNEEKFKSYIQNAPNGIFIADENGKYIEVNKAACRITGYSEDELLRLTIPELIQDEFSEKAKNHFQTVVKEGFSSRELGFVTKSGEKRVWSVDTVKLSETRFLGFAKDITERKRVEEALKESEERAKLQRKSITEITIEKALLNKDLKTTYKNVCEILAKTIHVARTSIWELSEDGAELHCLNLYDAVENTHSDGSILQAHEIPNYFTSLKTESRIYAEDAQHDPRTMELPENYLKSHGITSMLDAGIMLEGKLVGVVCCEHIGAMRKWHADEESFVSTFASYVSQLISEFKRKQAEEVILDLKEFNESIVTNLAEGIILENDDGIIQFANPAMLKMLGYKEGELIGEHWKCFVPDDQIEVVKNANKRREKGESDQYEMEIVRKDGERIFVLVGGVPNVSKGAYRGLLAAFTDITEQKLYNERLKEKNEQFETIIRSANLGWWDWDIPSGDEVYNDILAENLGYKLNEIEPHVKWWQEKIHPDDTEQVYADLHAHFEGKTDFYRNKHRLKIKSGEWKWFLDFGKVVERDNKGNAIRMIGTLRDIDKEERTQEKIQSNLQQIEVINANTPNIIWKSDIDESGTFVNSYISEVVDAFLALPEGSIKNNWDKYFSYVIPEYLPQIKRLFKKAIENPGQLFSFSYEVEKANGEIAWFTSSGKVMLKNNKLTVYGSTVDVTEQKQAEKEMIKLSTAVKQSPSVIVITDTKGNLQYVNPKFTEITGYNLQEAKGKNAHILKSGELTDEMYNELWETISSGKIWRGEFHNKKKNGELFWERASVSPILNEKGKTINYIKVAEDITEKKITEKELIEAKEKAEESNRLKSAFLANMSHEIRTPMNGILGFTNLLLEPDLGDDTKEEFIGIINKSGERMLKTVNDIIEISKVEAGIVEVNKSIIDLVEISKNLMNFFKFQAQQKGLMLSFYCDDTSLLIQTDESKLVSILTNLIRNAIKYTDYGEIQVNCLKKKDYIQFSVKDTGIGVPENRLTAIFNRFEQADIEDTRAYEGSGLGLAITKSYVEMLGGKIWVESVVGKGSEFYFTLPNLTEITKPTFSDIPEKNDTNDGFSQRIKILVVDDDKNSADLLKVYLKQVANTILYANSGKQAIEFCKNNPDIDLVLMDIKMHAINGLDATKEIRKFNKEVLIIAQSAYALSGDKENAIEAGCNDYITKPIRKDKLLALIQNYF